MKTFLLIVAAFILGIFILWILLIFPYPSATSQQLAVTKRDLIEGILKREIILRKLYANANGYQFVPDEAFRKKLNDEREKFYKYCDNKNSFDYKEKYCEITREMSLFDIDRYTTYSINYKFDSQSKDFFNRVKIYMAHHKNDRLLYQAKIAGFEVEYSFFNAGEEAEHYWLGIPTYEPGSSEPVEKNNLVHIQSDVHYKCDKSIKYKSCWVAFREIDTYIKRRKLWHL